MKYLFITGLTYKIAFVASIVLFPLSAMAADFTFVVPVDVKSLHSNIIKGKVACSVSTSNRGARTPRVGSNQTEFNLVDGGFQGDIAVEVNADNPRMRSGARSWICSLRLLDSDGAGWLSTGGYYSGPLAKYTRNRSAPILGFDEGRIP